MENIMMPTQDITTKKDQYTLWQILGIWLTAGAPMWLLGWVAYPALSDRLLPLDAGLLRVKLFTVGLIWEFALAMFILHREEGNIQLNTISRRFWLTHPVSPVTGETKKALWWWLIPMILALVFSFSLELVLTNLWTAFFPIFAKPKGYDASLLFSPELRAQWIGAWHLLGLFFVFALFNTVLGEEFLFRGVLLPKMEGVFGKWDWVANGVLFGFYHLHQPWSILYVVFASLIFAFPSKRFHSNWFSIILHSGQSIILLFLILGLVLGLA